MIVETWPQWLARHAQALDQGYEKDFVKSILSRIPEISPADLHPQYGFTDGEGRKRRIDFVIINKGKGYFLPIELDGANKDVLQHKWADFLQRQNDLMEQFGPLLRFSNRQMSDKPDWIINRIRKALKLQWDNHEAIRVQREDAAKRDSELRASAKALADAQARIAQLTRQLDDPTVSHTNLAAETHWLETLQETHRKQQAAAQQSSSRMHDLKMHQLQQNLQAMEENYSEVSDENNVMIKALSAIAVAATLGMLLLGYRLTQAPVSPVATRAPLAPAPLEPEPTPEPTPQPPSHVAATDSNAENIAQAESDPESARPRDSAAFVPTTDARLHVGDTLTLCGRLASIKAFRGGTYLNFDHPYPRESLTAVVWSDAGIPTGQAERWQGSNLCVDGKVVEANRRISSPRNEEVHFQVHVHHGQALWSE